jgi:hypothetical protein
MIPRLSPVSAASRVVDGRLELVFDAALVAHPAWTKWLRAPPEDLRHPSVHGVAPLVATDAVVGSATWLVGEARPLGEMLAERGASPRAAFDLLAGLMHVAVRAVAAHGPLGLIGPDTVAVGGDGAPVIAGWGLPSPMVAALDGSWQPSSAAVRYAAPELLDGGAPDLRSTAFGLAMLCAELGLGRPVLGGDAADALEAALVGVRPDALGPPGAARDLLAASLSRDPRVRFDPRRLGVAAAEVRADGPPAVTWAGAANEIRTAPVWLATLREARAARPAALAVAADARQAGQVAVAEALDAAIFRFDRAALGVDDVQGGSSTDPTTSTEMTLALRLLRVAADAGAAMGDVARKTTASLAEARRPVAVAVDDGPNRDVDAVRDAACDAAERAVRLASDPLLEPAGLSGRASRLSEEAREATDAALRLVDAARSAAPGERTGSMARARVAAERARRAAGEIERMVEAARQIDATARAAEARAASDAVLRAERARVQGGGDALLEGLVDEASRAAEAASSATTLELARAARSDAEGAATRAESALAGIVRAKAERAVVAEREAARARKRDEALSTLAGLAAEASADGRRIRDARAQLGDGEGAAELDAAVGAVHDAVAALTASVDGDPLDVVGPRVAAREALRALVRKADDEIAATRRRWATALATAESERIRRAAVAAAAVEAGAVATSARQRVDQTRAVLRGLLDDIERLEVARCLPLLERAAEVLDVADFHVAEAERAAESASAQSDPEEARAHARTAASFAERIVGDLPEADEALAAASSAVAEERAAFDVWRSGALDTAAEARAMAAARQADATRVGAEAKELGWDEPPDGVAAQERVVAALRGLDRAEEEALARGSRPAGPSNLDEAVLELGDALVVLGDASSALAARCAEEREARARRESARSKLTKMLQEAGDGVSRAAVELAEETRVLAGGDAPEVVDALKRAHEALESARGDARRLQEVAADGLAFEDDALGDLPETLAASIRAALAAMDAALADAATAAERWETERNARVVAARALGAASVERGRAAWQEVLEAAGRAGVMAEDPTWKPRMDEVAASLADAVRVAGVLAEVDAPDVAAGLVTDVDVAVEAMAVAARRLAAGLERVGDERRLAAEDAIAVGALRQDAAALAETADTLHAEALAVVARIEAEADEVDRAAADAQVRAILAQLAALAARGRTAAEMVDAGSRRAAEDLVEAQRQGVARMQRMLGEMNAVAQRAAAAAHGRALEAFHAAAARLDAARQALSARHAVLLARLAGNRLPLELAEKLGAAVREPAPTPEPPGDPAALREATDALAAAAFADEAALSGLDVVARWIDDMRPTPVPRPRVARRALGGRPTLNPEDPPDAAHARLRRAPDAPVAVASLAVRLRDALVSKGLPEGLTVRRDTPVPIPRETRPADDTPTLHGRLRRSTDGDGR